MRISTRAFLVLAHHAQIVDETSAFLRGVEAASATTGRGD